MSARKELVVLREDEVTERLSQLLPGRIGYSVRRVRFLPARPINGSGEQRVREDSRRR